MVKRFSLEAVRKYRRMLNKNPVFYSDPSEAKKRSDWMLDRKPAGGFQ